MNQEEQQLSAIKRRMTADQRSEMAELIKNELKRRSSEAVGGKVKNSKHTTKREVLGEMYGDIDEKIKQLRISKLENKIRGAKSRSKTVDENNALLKVKKIVDNAGSKIAGSCSLDQIFLAGGIVVLACAKIAFSSGVVTASVDQSTNISTASLEMKSETTPNTFFNNIAESQINKDVITELDARRVELEQRKSLVESKEAEIKNQTQALNERLAELRSLTDKLAKIREEKDHQYESRMEQLSSVYGAMAPKEAAPLIGKLNHDIALELLERMPSKQMGQILSVMEPERAIELTTALTDKRKM